MATILNNRSEHTHLRGDGKTLCGETITGAVVEEGELTCPKCANIALTAIELSTKKERKEWRKL